MGEGASAGDDGGERRVVAREKPKVLARLDRLVEDEAAARLGHGVHGEPVEPSCLARNEVVRDGTAGERLPCLANARSVRVQCVAEIRAVRLVIVAGGALKIAARFREAPLPLGTKLGVGREREVSQRTPPNVRELIRVRASRGVELRLREEGTECTAIGRERPRYETCVERRVGP